MNRKVLGFLLLIIGFAGMVLAAYLFMTGSADRNSLFQVTAYMIVGAGCFFTGIHYVYTSGPSKILQPSHPASRVRSLHSVQEEWQTAKLNERTTTTENL